MVNILDTHLLQLEYTFSFTHLSNNKKKAGDLWNTSKKSGCDNFIQAWERVVMEMHGALPSEVWS